jgi:ABC-type transport system substrate-binding protein
MRKLAFGSVVLLLVTLGWSGSSVGEQTPTPQGELRVVDKNISNFGTITFMVFEHLFDLNKEGELVPRLATGWRWLDDATLEITLRQGVTFHNGEAFNAEIVKLNVEESHQLSHAFYPGEYLKFKPGVRMDIRDPYTMRFHFAEPDGAALVRLSYLHLGNRQFFREGGWGQRHW